MSHVHEVVEFRKRLGVDLKTFIVYIESINHRFDSDVSIKYDLSGEVTDRSLIMFSTNNSNNISLSSADFYGDATILDSDGFIYKVKEVSDTERPDFVSVFSGFSVVIDNHPSFVKNLQRFELVITLYIEELNVNILHVDNDDNNVIMSPVTIDVIELYFDGNIVCEIEFDYDDKPTINEWDVNFIIEKINENYKGDIDYNEVFIRYLSNMNFEGLHENYIFYKKIE